MFQRLIDIVSNDIVPYLQKINIYVHFNTKKQA